MYTLDYKKYAQKIRQAAAESVVLLKNENNTLPVQKNEKISIFGRAQIDTYYCGTGSGGMVNIPYLVNIADGLKAKRAINEEIFELYANFVEENPFDKGNGWAQEPFSQKELALSVEIVEKASQNSDVAIFVIGRSAGEDKDCEPIGGSYYLSEIEKENLNLICEKFGKVVVVLNIGGVMDLSYIVDCNPSAILIAWHGGIESGNGYADAICGDVNPCGALPDTIARKLEDYPSTKNFGDAIENFYTEDIFVGYRYFETFAPEKVLFPFGFGLSYTNYEINDVKHIEENDKYIFNLTVKNTGAVKGKKAVQLYVEAPSVKLGKAKISLVGFAKTAELEAGGSQNLSIEVSKKDMASFDEELSAFVLENGNYQFKIGFNSRQISTVATVAISETEVVEKCTPALLPIKKFKKMTSTLDNSGYVLSYEDVKIRDYDLTKRISEENDKIYNKTENNFIFDDLKNGKISVEEFVNDLSDLELIHMSRGEGMCSPKVTPGTAGCYGGVSEILKNVRKMPLVCCSDGPSGIRMDCGTMAISVPNATAIASTFDTKLVEELFDFLSLEMLYHKIDTLLGPGMNIHRNPLCGRNFEYYSEDPLLTGKMAMAQLKVMNQYDITGTIKHFAANNQEKARKIVDSIVSARALREIYLKGFEMVIKSGFASSVMTAYNPINGIQAASNFDLNTTILRGDWGFDGVVMTDWWATMNKEGGESSEKHTADMINSQNDVFMVCANAEENSIGDDSETELSNGNLKRYALVRNGINIVKTMLKYNCTLGNKSVELLNVPESVFNERCDLGSFDVGENTEIDCKLISTKKGISNSMTLNLKSQGKYVFTFDLFADAVELAQVPLTIKANGAVAHIITLKGGTSGVYTCEIDMFATINTYLELFFSESGMIINSFNIKKI